LNEKEIHKFFEEMDCDESRRYIPFLIRINSWDAYTDMEVITYNLQTILSLYESMGSVAWIFLIIYNKKIASKRKSYPRLSPNYDLHATDPTGASIMIKQENTCFNILRVTCE
jgi:hypothetical protein